MIGYNIFGFDYKFLFFRSGECGCTEEFLQLSRYKNKVCGKQNKHGGEWSIQTQNIKLKNGNQTLYIIQMEGRLQVDMYYWVMRTERLASFKLDDVSAVILGDSVSKTEDIQFTKEEKLDSGSGDDVDVDYTLPTTYTRVYSKNLMGLFVGNYVSFEEITHSSSPYMRGKKFRVVSIEPGKYFDIEGTAHPKGKTNRWGLAKDDVSPRDIFEYTKQGPDGRAIVAKYCVQDCDIVHYLFAKIDVLTDLIEGANFYKIPMTYFVFRGQSIKLMSLVSDECRHKGYFIPELDTNVRKDKYEGGLVLDPLVDMYLKDGVAVGDFASLYPSSMIAYNICPSSMIGTISRNKKGRIVQKTGDWKYDNLKGKEYVSLFFDTFRMVRKHEKGREVKEITGTKECRYVMHKSDTECAVIPGILRKLIAKRKSVRKQIPNESDPFRRNMLDKRQLAIKEGANSIYGQLGTPFSCFFEADVAASTTAAGRSMVMYAKKVIEQVFQNVILYSKTFGKDVRINPSYVYGDTDSVFFRLNITDVETGEELNSLLADIELSQVVCEMVSRFLPTPEDFEYEKVFFPLCLLSKKRYVGILFEFDPNKGKRKEMGVVLKRLDNAPIVKDVYGGLIDILMKGENQIENAITYLDSCLDNLVKEVTPMEKLIITKSLRSDYKNPQQIEIGRAHV